MPHKIEEFNHRPHVVPDATSTSAGVMSASDKTKLDSVSLGLVAVLPTPTAQLRGSFAVLQGAPGTPDALYVCLKLGDDSFGWVPK